MKRLLLYGLMAGVVATSALTSCSNSMDDLNTAESVANYKHSAFSQSFVNTFGAIDPTATWGFGTTTTRTTDIGNNFNDLANLAWASYSNEGTLERVEVSGTKYVTMIHGGNSSDNFYINAFGSGDQGRCVGMTEEEYSWLILTNSSEKAKSEFVSNGVYTFLQSSAAADRDQNDPNGLKSNGFVYVLTDYVPGATRILAEDLGTIGDFDYNDVVIDVWGKPQVLIQAVGGSLPVYLGCTSNQNWRSEELHAFFGVDTNQPINVNGGTKSLPAKVMSDLPAEINKNNIRILVIVNSQEVELKHTRGEAPEMLAVDPSYPWNDEGVRINLDTLPFAD